MAFLIRVWGSRARFTAPHTRAEPYSEDVPPPSPLTRLMGAIYSKPEMAWLIDAIHVMRPIRKENMVVKGLNDGEKLATLQTATDLIDVEYILRVRIAVNPDRVGPDLAAAYAKYNGEAARRLASGQRYQPLFLGIREYAANYELLPPDYVIEPIRDSRPLGPILYANVPIDFAADEYESIFFEGELDNGTLYVPQALHEEFVPQIMAKVHERAGPSKRQIDPSHQEHA